MSTNWSDRPTAGHPVVSLLDNAVAAHPNAPAIETPDRTITYQELATEVARLAAWLNAQGVSPQERIAIRGERTSLFVTALLASWCVGAVPAPIDGSHPPARIARYETAARAHWTLSLTPGPALVRLEEPGTPVHEDGLSHILFTSGTTGDPAAVAVGPEPLRAMASWYSHEFAPGPLDKVGLVGGLGHDPILRDVIAALLGSATLVIPEPDVLSMPGRLADFVERMRLTILHCTPPLLEFGVLMGAPPERRLSGLRLILCGGALMSRGIAEQTSRLCDTARLFNVYGATETPQVAAAHEVHTPNSASHDPSDAVPIGTGVAGAVVLLGAELPDADLNADEIIIRSKNLALGYLDDEHSNDRFRPDPSGETAYRLYLTGDLGERGANGELYVTGRADRQISVNGYRVALQEIEAAALRHPQIMRASATLESGPRGEVLAILVAVRDGESVTPAELRRHLRGELPSYAVPSAVRFGEPTLDHNHKARIASSG
ncbi:AMP-binding protein [Streptomyces caniferus]|uniref:AMP-binding protein n=1 Tax=Streptomyces caniferus TaxID=285557 RepID=UPI0033E0EF88